MEKAALLKRLQEVRKLAYRGDRLIEAQRRVVASLAAAGADTTSAQKILDDMEQTQKRQLGEIDQLLDALDKTSPLDSQ
jgi:hypothetical protein